MKYAKQANTIWYSVFLIAFFWIIFCLIPVKVYSSSITSSGQNTVAAIVPGAAPATSPTIDTPAQGLNLDNKNILVEGSCITGLIVKIFSNNVFAGSAVCQSGSYNMQIDLFVGRNDLIARQYDTLNQSSPDSPTTTVYYLPPNIQPGIPDELNSGSETLQTNFALILNYDYTVNGVFPGQVFRLPINIEGGLPPYAVGVDWGDSSTDVFSRESDETFYAEHIYKDSGLYTVKIKVSDKNGDTAFSQFVVVVKGEVNSPIEKLLKGDILPIQARLIMVPIIASGCFYAGKRVQTRKHKKTCKYCK